MSGSRGQAVDKVPFSSLFYCSNPLAAGLTRKRTQVFFIFLSLLHLPESYFPSESVVQSTRLNFTILEHRDGKTYDEDSSMPQIGVSRRGHDLETGSVQERQGSSLIISFPIRVEWDSWHLVTATDKCERDPVKFSLQSYDGANWKYVGSSRVVQIGRTVLFMHEYFQTSTERGFRHDFPLLQTNLIGFTYSIWLGAAGCAFVALFGFLQRERLASDINATVNALMSLFLFTAAYQTYPLTSSGNYTAYCFCVVGIMMVSLAVLCFCRQWLLHFIVLGLAQSCICLYLQQYSHNDRNFLWTSAAAMVCALVALGTKAYRRFIAISAAREIEPDRQAYDALWRLTLEDGRALAAQAELSSILLQLKSGGDKATVRQYRGRKAAASHDVWEGGLVRGPAQQTFECSPAKAGEGAGRLLPRLKYESFCVQEDLDLLYDQVLGCGAARCTF